jgi:hypothetical protein
MKTHIEADLNRLAGENTQTIHSLLWLPREIFAFIKFAVIFCLSVLALPFIVAGLIAHYAITGRNVLDADGVLALKVLYTFCAPVITCVAYRFAQAASGRRAAVKATYVFSIHKVFFITLGLMLAGAIVAFPLWNNMNSDMGLVALVVYLSSPLLLLLVKRRGADAASREPKVW